MAKREGRTRKPPVITRAMVRRLDDTEESLKSATRSLRTLEAKVKALRYAFCAGRQMIFK